MSLEAGEELIYGLVRFYSLDDMRRYIRELLADYEREVDRLSNQVGSLLRTQEENNTQLFSKAWFRIGSLYANSADSRKGLIEVTFQILKELRPKLVTLRDALQSFETMDNLDVPSDASLVLYLKNGVPERIIVDTDEGRPAIFTFNGTINTV